MQNLIGPAGHSSFRGRRFTQQHCDRSGGWLTPSHSKEQHGADQKNSNQRGYRARLQPETPVMKRPPELSYCLFEWSPYGYGSIRFIFAQYCGASVFLDDGDGCTLTNQCWVVVDNLEVRTRPAEVKSSFEAASFTQRNTCALLERTVGWRINIEEKQSDPLLAEDLDEPDSFFDSQAQGLLHPI